MLRCIEHNGHLRRTHKTEGLGACRQLRHEYSIIAASYNAGPAEDKFAEWDNSSSDYHLTHLDNPTPTARKLKVDMPILFIPKAFKLPAMTSFRNASTTTADFSVAPYSSGPRTLGGRP